MTNPKYGDYVWTKHALSRLKDRKLTQSEVFSTINNPTTSTQGSSPRSIKYRQVNSTKLIEVIVKIEQNQKIILTCWSSPRTKFKQQIPIWEKVIRHLFQLFK